MKTEISTQINYPVLVRNTGSTFEVYLYFEENYGRTVYSKDRLGGIINRSIYSNDLQIMSEGDNVTFVQRNVKVDK